MSLCTDQGGYALTDALILDEMDKRLLRFIQDSFPLTPDPWQDIGEVVGLARENVLVRVRELQEKGIIGTDPPVRGFKATRPGCIHPCDDQNPN